MVDKRDIHGLLRNIGLGLQLPAIGMETWNKMPFSGAQQQATYTKMLDNYSKSGGFVTTDQMEAIEKHTGIGVRHITIPTETPDTFEIIPQTTLDKVVKGYTEAGNRSAYAAVQRNRSILRMAFGKPKETTQTRVDTPTPYDSSIYNFPQAPPVSVETQRAKAFQGGNYFDQLGREAKSKREPKPTLAEIQGEAKAKALGKTAGEGQKPVSDKDITSMVTSINNQLKGIGYKYELQSNVQKVQTLNAIRKYVTSKKTLADEQKLLEYMKTLDIESKGSMDEESWGDYLKGVFGFSIGSKKKKPDNFGYVLGEKKISNGKKGIYIGNNKWDIQ